jgi:hypothetical protein
MVFKMLIEDKKIRKYALMDLHCDNKGGLLLEYLNKNNKIQSSTLTEFLDDTNRDGNPNFEYQYNYLKK